MDESHGFDELYPCLLRAQRRARDGKRAILASFSRPWPDTDPIPLFCANQPHEARLVFWSAVREDFSLLGFGCVDEFTTPPGQSWATLQIAWQTLLDGAVIEGDHHPLLCGGFAFDATADRQDAWRTFPGAALTLPRFLLARQNGRTRLTVNLRITADSDPYRLFAATRADWARLLARPLPPPRATAAPPPSPAGERLWRDKVALAVTTIRAGRLRKVVLARTERIGVDQPMVTILDTLRANRSGAYLFAFSRDGTCFLGASPERLIRFRHGWLRTCALAGSAPRAGSPVEDRRLGRALLASRKDRHEHALVVETLCGALAGYCRRLRHPRRPLLCKLRHIQHLLTPIAGQAREGILLLDLLERLHPTPAVGGLPRDAALGFIRRAEGLDRGWYAGPVGWIDHRGEGEFAVALRSALLRDGLAELYAGCGIVADSDPEAEFRETCVKLRPMTLAMRGDTATTAPKQERSAR